MKKDEALIQFRRTVLPGIKADELKSGRKETAMRVEAWRVFVDSLFSSGEITRNQFLNWSNPYDN